MAHLSEGDARLALARLADTPGDAGDSNAVTIDLGNAGVAVRWRVGEGHPPGELRLADSRRSGPAVRYALDRRHLLRGLALGFRTLRACGANRPLAMTDRRRLYLAAGHDPSTAITPDTAVRAMSDSIAPQPCRSQIPTPELPMPTPPTRTDPPPEDTSAPDPLADAEAIRDLLADAARRAHRLVRHLKVQRKADRAVTQAVRSLRALPLPGRA